MMRIRSPRSERLQRAHCDPPSLPSRSSRHALASWPLLWLPFKLQLYGNYGLPVVVVNRSTAALPGDNTKKVANYKKMLRNTLFGSSDLLASGVYSRRKEGNMRSTNSRSPDAHPQGINNGLTRTHFGAPGSHFAPMESTQPIDFEPSPIAGPSKIQNYERNPPPRAALAPINICNADPLLHFPNDSHKLNLSDVERISNPITAPWHRPTPTPCNQHYYFGHRIRPRVRPLGRVSEATSGDRKSGWWPFLFVAQAFLPVWFLRN
jgi:hypothetical protein